MPFLKVSASYYLPVAQMIGKCGLIGTEVGLLFRQDVWGKGFATEALTSLLDRVFGANSPDARSETQQCLGAVVADVDPRNQRSLQLLARFGFEKTGSAEQTFKLGTEWVDSVYLMLTRDRWLMFRNPTKT